MDEQLMDDLELEEALAPVRQFHTAQHVTPYTVLAAHLRSCGVHPVGPIWDAAKRRYAAGYGFAEAAAETAAEFTDHALRDDPHEQPAPPPGPATSYDRHVEPDTTYISTEAGAAIPSPPLDRPEPAPVASPTSASLARRTCGPSPVGGHGSLEWFPKVFGPGDLDGKGASRLLGTPNVPLSAVLVRETAQNSWDARLGHRPVTFALHLRRLRDLEREILRDRVFTGPGPELALRQALERPGLRVLEVADRGTKGLGGPTRNDRDPPVGSATNYIDLVLNVGAPRDVHLGGGTYGFGKTISYRASRAGTVLIWSRSQEPGGVEDRLIGSAIGDSFSFDGRRFTGRHWWGALRPEEGRVEPWTHDDAAQVARAAFDSSYEGDETGTTLMIIDPDLGGEDDAADIERLSDAILWNLWPKLLPTLQGSQPMNVELYHDGTRLPLPSILEHPVLAGFADALQSVRATQDGRTYSPRFNTTVHEVRSHRPKLLIGHLAVTRFPKGAPLDARDTVPFPGPSSHVAWMRHDAELVVRYDERARLDSEVLQWAGVFKPVADQDDAFAEAEPPAHDDWVPASIEDPLTRSVVRVGIRRSQEIVAAELAPPEPAATSDGERRSVAALADSLSKLIGGVPGSKPQRGGKTSGAGGGSRRKRSQARVLRWDRGENVAGYRTMAVLVGVTGASRPVSVRADVGVATDGGRMHDDELVQPLGWCADSSGSVMQDEPLLSDGEECWFLIRCASGVGVDLSLSCLEDVS